jgi:hypothetical protein
MTMLRRCACVFGVLIAVAATAAHAERFLIQRGPAIYLASKEGDARRLIEIGTTSGTLWTASPDGHRVYWLKASSVASPEDGNLATRPVIISVIDITGRRQKKLLASDALKDRLGRVVTQLAPTKSEGAPTKLSDWQPISLSLSADGRTLYLGCVRIGAAEVTTVGIDALSGAALVDADGNWKCIAAAAQTDARAGQLAGIGVSEEVGIAPLLLVDLSQGGLSSRVPPGGGKTEYSAALWPALSPTGSSIAFTSLPRGLWLAEQNGASVRRLIASDATRARWSDDNKTIYFLAPRPVATDKLSYDLYAISAISKNPKILLQNVDWFDVIPD